MSEEIQVINDNFRKNVLLAPQNDGEYVVTPKLYNVVYKNYDLQREILNTLTNLTDDYFNENNDPDGYHNFGKITVGNDIDLFWKIDHYDGDDIKNSYKVLTIMLTEES